MEDNSEVKAENNNESNIDNMSKYPDNSYCDNPYAFEPDKSSADRFKAIGLATVIYAFVYSICLYKNLMGIMTPVFTIATVIYLWIALPALADDWEDGRKRLKQLIPYFVGIVLLGISVFMTADICIVTFNYMGIFLLAMTALIRFFCNESEWGVGKYISALLEICISTIFFADKFFKDQKSNKMLGKSRIKINKNVKYVITGIIFAIPFLVIVIALLSSADVIFENVIDNVFGTFTNSLEISWDMVGFLLLTFFVMIIVYGLMYKLSVHGIADYEKSDKKYEPVVGITFCASLTAVYLLFSGIQILSLFIGSSMLPEGYSYSSYARQGFFQLLFVAALNLLIVLVCNSIFENNKALRIILTVMCICTYIMIASSLVRMLMYIDTYDLTYLRLLVLFALLLIAVLLAGMIVRIYKTDFKLMRYFIAVTSVLYITFSFAHPDYIIAKYNLSNIDTVQLNNYDLKYLVNEMSGDAAPAFYEFASELEGDENAVTADYLRVYFSNVNNEYEKGVRQFNFSRYRAHLLEERFKNLYE